MSEKFPTVIEAFEKVPSQKEILDFFDSLIRRDFDVVRILEDEEGPYLITVKAPFDSGNFSVYTYMRAGTHPEGSSNENSIDVVLFFDGLPVYGSQQAVYKNGRWEIV